ncbi:hypothetical protein HK104_011242 [Borealophlyctis nickersoniae]|nr:hypothetical protein HK104_011242 [Borealophlyctis nickersoniae]
MSLLCRNCQCLAPNRLASSRNSLLPSLSLLPLRTAATIAARKGKPLTKLEPARPQKGPDPKGNPRLNGYPRPPFGAAERRGTMQKQKKARNEEEEESEIPTITKTLEVGDEEHGCRLDEFLQKKLGIRRNLARLKILNGEVSITGSAHSLYFDMKPAWTLHAEDRVEVLVARPRGGKDGELTRAEQEELKSETEEAIENLRASILYKDQHIFIINKPMGLAVQGGSKVHMSLDQLLEGLQGSAKEPPRIVHRLDKNTTGILILARTKEAATKYWGIVMSPVPAESGKIVTGLLQVGLPPNEKTAIVEWHDEDTRSSIDSPIRRAETIYRVLEAGKRVSLLELVPVTGRKHQLRVHCASVLKTPVLGDYKYGPGFPKSMEGMVSRKGIPMHLHMRSLVIKNWYGPGVDLEATAPIPPHFVKTMQSIGLTTDGAVPGGKFVRGVKRAVLGEQDTVMVQDEV